VDGNAESLSEFEGDELELNLEQLRIKDKAETLAKPVINWKIVGKKMSRDWSNAERNWALGYTGLSKHSRDCRASFQLTIHITSTGTPI
jgi:hypothetical protein